MRIAVLMTCYNRVETTLRCLDGLLAQCRDGTRGLDVFLVDDGSTDGTGARVLEWSKSAEATSSVLSLHLIPGCGNLFWCKGMRLAWETAAATSDYDAYLWLNDDVVLRPDAISGLLADVALVGDEAILIGACASGDEIAYGAGGGSGRWGKLEPNGRPQETRGGMSGNFVWVPRKAYERIGPIYGGYSHGYGDYDYGWQADRKGVKRYLCSRVVGECPQQPERYRHRLKDLSWWGRLKILFAPNGFNIVDNFTYKRRNFGWLNAVASTGHVLWIRVVKGVEK